MPIRLALCLILCVPAASFAADKELVRLQQYVTSLEEAIKGMQKVLDDKLTAVIQKNGEQSRESSDRISQSVTALGERFQKSFQDSHDNQTRIVSQLAALDAGQKQISTDLGNLKEAVTALTSTFTKLTTRISDLEQAVHTMQSAKPAVPEGPQMPASAMIRTAESDYRSGKLDLALEGYKNFMKWYPTDAQAPDAVYHLAVIQYSSQQYDESIASVDQLLQLFPTSEKVPDALLYKAKCYADQKRWNEFNDVLSVLKKRFPTHSATQQATSLKPPAK